jgi:hypothetical protein
MCHNDGVKLGAVIYQRYGNKSLFAVVSIQLLVNFFFTARFMWALASTIMNLWVP